MLFKRRDNVTAMKEGLKTFFVYADEDLGVMVLCSDKKKRGELVYLNPPQFRSIFGNLSSDLTEFRAVKVRRKKRGRFAKAHKRKKAK